MKKTTFNDSQKAVDKAIDEYLSPHLIKKTPKVSKNKTVQAGAPEDRFKPDINNGLTNDQVNKRLSQNQVNAKSKQMSRSSAKIICSNLFTFFNLLCILCLISLIVVKETKVTNYFFVVIYAIILSLSIFQEIRAKKAIEKLSILNEPTAKVLRNGKFVELSVN